MHNPTRGIQLIAAPFTPFKMDGSIHFETIERQLQSLVDAGINGAFVCGTTGEGASLTSAERMDVARQWSKLRPKGFRVFVHVGHSALAEAKALAAHAQSIRADAVAAIGPFFFKPSTTEELMKFCAEIAAQAPELPFYYYHMPSLSGVNFRMSEFLPIASEHISNFGGIKFTHEDLMDYSECLALAEGPCEIFFGRDEVLLAGLALGARGAVGSTYNFLQPLYRKLIRAFEAGDLVAAREAQAAARRVIAIMLQYGGVPGAKAIMKVAGIDCGPIRSPLKALSQHQEYQLRLQLEKTQFFAVQAQDKVATPAS